MKVFDNIWAKIVININKKKVDFEQLVVRVWATAKKLRIEYMISYMLRFMLSMQFYAGTVGMQSPQL
ncbi:unnamed protein product [Lactuca virosa]|uniref:Uncharacterized protein n=1 Tax=Lactuca virosa TaxID=75947 RepID=A0AAU9MUX4_9ASTR|nr:unnamed protein product [Lactuca virosa]